MQGIEVPETVAEDGTYHADGPLFAGLAVYTADGKPGPANKAVVAALDEAAGLLAQGRLRHSYPHSWRSKAPLIFRATAQWFISMDVNRLREKALKALEETRFVPPAGYNRLSSLIARRAAERRVGEEGVSRWKSRGCP